MPPKSCLSHLVAAVEPAVVLCPGTIVLAARAPVSQSARFHQLGELQPPRRPLLSSDQDATPSTLPPLRRQNPREEPGASAAHARICAGGEVRSSFLPRASPAIEQTSLFPKGSAHADKHHVHSGALIRRSSRCRSSTTLQSTVR